MEHKSPAMITMLEEIVLQNTCKMMVLMLPLKVVTTVDISTLDVMPTIIFFWC